MEVLSENHQYACYHPQIIKDSEEQLVTVS
jgi:hypothetical protein